MYTVLLIAYFVSLEINLYISEHWIRYMIMSEGWMTKHVQEPRVVFVSLGILYFLKKIKLSLVKFFALCKFCLLFTTVIEQHCDTSLEST